MTPLSVNNSPFLPLIEGGFLSQIQSCIARQEWEDALSMLFNSLSFAEIASCYHSLFELLPICNEKQFRKLNEHLPHLLERSPLFFTEQRKLSLALAQWHIEHPGPSFTTLLSSCCGAMHYFAKTLQIAEKEEAPCAEIHPLASRLFIPVIQHLTADFRERLDSARRKGDQEQFRRLIQQIGDLKRFCVLEEDQSLIRTLYLQASNIFSRIESQEKKQTYGLWDIRQGLAEPFSLPEKPPTERYADALYTFRTTFSSLPPQATVKQIRHFQTQATQAFKTLFHTFVDDAFALLGPPPCGYDIRAMGSCGREEICPFSDLEFMILIQDPIHAPYFKTLVQILEIEIASLGETSTDHPPFTCIHRKNPSGLHIDMSPAQNPDLIRTPSEMARLPQNPCTHPQNIEQTVLKTYSLSCNDPTLFATYQKELEPALHLCRQERATQFFALRLQDYQTRWKQPFNRQSGIFHLKQDYVELLNHLLSDMALYHGLTETNTLDIIDALVQREIFTEKSGNLLKESVAAVYAIRIRLHLHYREQKEEARSPETQAPFLPLEPQEIQALERCCSLVLFPLYHSSPQTLHQADLIHIAFTEKLATNSLSPSFIRLMVQDLLERGAGPKEYRAYYSTLSKMKEAEPLRDAYLEALEKGRAQGLLEKLLSIPTPSGMRARFRRNFALLHQGLIEMTDPSETRSEISVSLTASSLLSPRYLKPAHIDALLDSKGNIRKMYPHSAHNVCQLIHEQYAFHFKQKPSHPLMEYAIHNLTSRIAGSLTPAVELALFTVRCQGKTKNYPVLISETIPGPSLKESQDLDPKQWTWMLLCSILTRPGDGRLSNYVVKDRQIYCVDNDVSFIEPVVSHVLSLSRQVQFSASPFCILPLTTPLDLKVLEAF